MGKAMGERETMPSILTINGGSSSTKFALYQAGEPLERRFHGKIDRIGLSGTTLTFNDSASNHQDSCSLAASDHKSAANFLMDWLAEKTGFESVRAVNHKSGLLGVSETSSDMRDLLAHEANC